MLWHLWLILLPLVTANGQRFRRRGPLKTWTSWSRASDHQDKIVDEDLILRELRDLILEEDEEVEDIERKPRQRSGGVSGQFERQILPGGGELRCETNGFETRSREVCEEQFETECTTIQVAQAPHTHLLPDT